MQHPRISVIIATYNRDLFIVNCLEHLAAQTLAKELFEVWVVDNNSTDQTAAKVNAYLKQHPNLPFHYVFEKNKGLSFARNRGIEESAGEILVFLDDDAEPEPDLLEIYLTFFEENPTAAGAGGRILPKFSEAPEPVWMNKYLNGYLAKVDLGGPPRIYSGRMKYPIGCNMVYRKKALDQVGRFNTALTFRGDDKYIFQMISAQNPNIFYLNNALVYHNIPAQRLQFPYFKTLYLKTGNEEKLRVKQSGGYLSVVLKLVEYLAKFGVSLAIWLLFTLKGQEIKGRYVALSQWFTLKGFLMGQVTVR